MAYLRFYEPDLKSMKTKQEADPREVMKQMAKVEKDLAEDEQKKPKPSVNTK